MPEKPSICGKRSPRKQSSSHIHCQLCKPSCLVNLTQRKRNSQGTLALSLRLPVLFFSGYQHTLAFGEMKWQMSSQKKEGKSSNSHHICPTESSKLLSIIKRKPSSTARLDDTNQTRTHSDQLPRHQQTTTCHLRIGHCRLNSHLKKIGVKTSAQCLCGKADQTPEHYMQSCSLYHQARQQIWPTCVSLKTKLLGSVEHLFMTYNYAALTGERV